MRPGWLIGAASILAVAMLLAGVLPGAATWPATTAADDVAEFYRGKQMKLVIGFDSGTASDVYARTVARHMEKYLPGNPHVIAQNMPGAAGRAAANFLATAAPRDGSVIGTIASSAPVDELFRHEGVQFQSNSFRWIGNPIVDNIVMIARSDTGIVTLDDAVSQGGLICGGGAVATPSVALPRILHHMLGARIQVLPGYALTSPAFPLAMERGEINCSGGISWEASKLAFGHLFEEHKLNVLVQWGPETNPEVSAYARRDVPLVAEFAKTDADLKVLELVSSSVALGRPLLTPPEVPADRVAALREAFDRTMTDPAFIFEMQKARLALRPLSGEQLQRVVADVMGSSDDVVHHAVELMSQ
jgi:tripartite-type tricarboxylate transporter receptor subunit TctC